MHLMTIIILELVGIASVIGLSPAQKMNGNLSTTTSSPSPPSMSAATITSAPLIASATSNMTCPQCQVVARFGPLSMALWWTSSLSMTLDTISVLVTQYNNTAVTRTTTIHQDLSSINISTLSDVQSTAFEVLTAIDPEYGANGFALNNGTNAFVDGTFSVAYPTPFIGIQGFQFITVTRQDSECPNGLQYAGQNLGTVKCACMMQTYIDPNLLENTASEQVTLASAYYEIGNTQPVNNDLGTHLEGPIPINNVSYSNFIESVLGSESFNKYRSCVFMDMGVGPPALMIPVSALTTTTTATVKGAGNYGIQSPKPGSPITPVVPAATTTSTVPPSVPLVEPKPDKETPTISSRAPDVAPKTATPVAFPPVPIVDKPSAAQTYTTSPVTEPTKAGSETPVGSLSGSNTGQSGSNGGQNAVRPSDSGSNENADAGSQTETINSETYNTDDKKSVSAAAVAISYEGSSITPDTSSQHNTPQVGKLSPGGSPITTNGVVYSLALSATALVSNGQIISLPGFTAAAPIPSKQNAAPALTFADSTYTIDSSSNIIISGQTLTPGGPAVTVSNTRISLAPSASIAVIGGTTQSLYPVTPTALPEMTFAGTTYTANSDTAIVIQGQTLIPGSPAITISNTPMSLASGGNIAVIAGQTQILSSASHPTARPVLSFAGSTYTVNTASEFIINDQTLSPGSVITISNTPISLAADGSFAIIAGSSTQSLPAPTTPPTFTFNGTTYTADSNNSEFIIAGQTLTKGGAVSVSGTRISYYADGGGGGNVVVGGTSTEAAGSGLGGLIMSGFGGGGSGGVSTGPMQFTGGARRWRGFGFGRWWFVGGFIMGWMGWMGFR